VEPRHLPIAPLLLAMALLCAAMSACGPEIGDDCESSYDCASSSMICDTAAPDGYCLIEGCWDDKDCPEYGVCIAFANDERFCMRGCEDGNDCRDGYRCVHLQGQPRFCYVR